MDRLTLRLKSARRALTALKEAVAMADASDLVRDATIQRFEYTFGAVWKAARQFLLDEEGIEAPSPKTVARRSGEVGTLTDVESALRMTDDRNLTPHAYNEPVARQIFGRVPIYADLMEAWLKEMEDRSS